MALILLAALIALAPAVTSTFGFRGFVVAYALATLLWLPLRRRGLPLGVTIVAGIALRLLLVLHPPALSGDVYRYLSDGRTLAAGQNPYAYTPDDPRINHREIRSIYPPHAQLLFAAFHELTAWRLLILAVEVGAIVLLHKHRASLAFATCPLILFEGIWSGHLDAIAAVVLAVALLRTSGTAAGVAAGLKLIPLAAIPALLRRSPSRLRFAAACAIALILPFLPFLSGPLMPGLRDYATRWEFNSPLYATVHAIVEQIPAKAIWTAHPMRFELISDWVYRHLDPGFVTRGVLAVLAASAILLVRRVSSAVAVLLLCSPAIHPWYWLTLVPSAMVERSRWLSVALCAPFSYLLYDGAAPLLVFALCYAIPLITESRSRSESLRPQRSSLPPARGRSR